MTYIKTEELPGIVSLMKTYPDAAQPLNALVEYLLVRETPTFSKGERETVAAYVSFLNECQFCSECHGAVADYHMKEPGHHKRVWEDYKSAPISDRVKSLLEIAAKVQKSGKAVTQADVDAAKALGATEHDIHDTVLIAAAFCMYNRYVDGLGTFAPPRGDNAYQMFGAMLGEGGYMNSI